MQSKAAAIKTGRFMSLEGITCDSVTRVAGYASE